MEIYILAYLCGVVMTALYCDDQTKKQEGALYRYPASKGWLCFWVSAFWLPVLLGLIIWGVGRWWRD